MRFALLALVWAAGCGRDEPKPTASSAKPAAPAQSAATEDLAALRHPAPPRLVAIGDLHGDLEAARAALRLAGAIDEQDRWIGKDLVVVQTGDQIDRGDQDREILDLFDKLVEQAKDAGGAVYPLNGNHELMNAAGDFRYVTNAAFRGFEGMAGPVSAADPSLLRFPEPYRPRAAAFMPGGPYARMLARRGIAVVVGDSLFVHGGVLPAHVRYGLARLDREVRGWLEAKSSGGQSPPPRVIANDDGPVWTRRYSDRPTPQDCEVLNEALRAAGVERMVVGHTVQKEGINSACDGRVWRIDVGMASFYAGPIEVLEIAGDKIRPLKGQRTKSGTP